MTSQAIEIDARGLSCPLPILRLRKAIMSAPSGQEVRLTSTDCGAVKDVEAFCRQTGHALLSSAEDGGVYRFTVRAS